MPVEIIEGGPLVITELVPVADGFGNTLLKEEKTYYCRCGKTKKQPYCDGSHINPELEKLPK